MVELAGHLTLGALVERLLATRLGTAAVNLVASGEYGVMVAAEGDGIRAVPIDEVAGNLKSVPARSQLGRSGPARRYQHGGLTGKREISRKTA
mgnify:CR=1 FL=1